MLTNNVLDHYTLEYMETLELYKLQHPNMK